MLHCISGLTIILIIHVALCPELSDPVNGSVTLTGHSSGDKVNYTCNSGFALDGVSVLTCQSNGEWDNPPPTCLVAEGKLSCMHSYAK